jgi:hypothetical protein
MYISTLKEFEHGFVVVKKVLKDARKFEQDPYFNICTTLPILELTVFSFRYCRPCDRFSVDILPCNFVL